jgi:hypothetical protein
MIAAATRSSTARLSASAEPIAVAASPERMKIVEKLAMNSTLGPSTRRALTRFSSAGVTPTTVERYPGTSGSTHGERNETSPAATAASTPTPDAGSDTAQILGNVGRYDEAARAASAAIARESCPPCQAIGERPSCSISSLAPAIARA